jgi:pimeloyl-ACP methyl ester carboxylesterase
MRRIAQFIDTVPTHWRLARVQRGAAASTRADIGFLDIGQALVRYRQRGRGPSLIFATDPPVPLESYDALIDALADRYRVTVFEMPGFGCSLPRVSFRFSLPGATAALGRILAGLDGGPHHLVLPCVLGYLGIALARGPGRPLLASLVFSQTPHWDDAQTWLRGRDPQGLLRRPGLGQLGLALLRRRRVRGWYRTALGDPALVEPLTALTLQGFDHGACFCLASAFQDFLAEHHGLLGPVELPVLAVWGGRDPSHAASRPTGIRDYAPSAQLAHFDDAGHFPELERSARFSALLGDFLGA